MFTREMNSFATNNPFKIVDKDLIIYTIRLPYFLVYIFIATSLILYRPQL